MDAFELYHHTVTAMPASERLKLASLILTDLVHGGDPNGHLVHETTPPPTITPPKPQALSGRTGGPDTEIYELKPGGR